MYILKIFDGFIDLQNEFKKVALTVVYESTVFCIPCSLHKFSEGSELKQYNKRLSI